MFSEDLLEQVRGANPIYDVVSDYVSLKKSGRNYLGLCPFHGEKTPSFTVNDGVFSPWNGHKPRWLRPLFFRET